LLQIITITITITVIILFVCTASGCGSESDYLSSDQLSVGSSASVQFSSESVASRLSRSTRRGGSVRRNNSPSLHPPQPVDSPPISKSPSDRLSRLRTENQTSAVERSISNDSGVNCSGSDTLLDQTEDRSRLTDSDHVQLILREDDSGCHRVTSPPVARDGLATDWTRHSRSEPEIRRVIDTDDLKMEADDDNLTATKSHRQSEEASVSEMSTTRRRSSAVRCPRHGARDGDSVSARTVRRSSMAARPPQPDRITRTRRRHSFMLPNGSDLHPARFSAWPTIIEEGLQLTTDVAGHQMTGPRRSLNSRGTVVDGDLPTFGPTPKSGQQNADLSKVNVASCSSKEFGSPADFRILRARLRKGLQLADTGSEIGQMKECDVAIADEQVEGTAADRSALGAELGRPMTSPGGSPSTSPSVTGSPPSYSEALLHKALRQFDLTDAEISLAAAAHLSMTSSITADVTVIPEVGVEVNRPPPPPYQLRPRRLNCSEDKTRIPRRSRPVFISEDSEAGEGAPGSDDMLKNSAKPVVVGPYKTDRSFTDLRRSSSFASPRRQKENVCACPASSATSVTPRSSSVVASNASGPGFRVKSPAGSADTSRKSWRDSMLLRRRSLTTVKDRDWHRELVHQYSSGGTACSVNVSTTAWV